MRMRTLLLGVFLAACGPVMSPPDSGVRDAAPPPRLTDLGSGLYHDGELDTDCSFVCTEEGRRCVPPTKVYLSNFFEDAACTSPVLGIRDVDGPASYAVTTRTSKECSGTVPVAFRLKTAVPWKGVRISTGDCWTVIIYPLDPATFWTFEQADLRKFADRP